MVDPFSTDRQVHFGDFRFDLETLELWRNGVPVALAPKPARVLAALVSEPNRLLTREDLYKAGWDDQIVSYDLALNTAIRHIRRALEDRADEPSFIKTVPRRGYVFLAEVVVVKQQPSRPARTPVMLRVLPKRPWALAAPIAALLVVMFTWLELDHSPTVEVSAIQLLDGALDQTEGAVLEHRIRSTVARQAGRHVTVLASPLNMDERGSPAEYVIQGSVYTTSGRPQFDVRVVRTSDQAIVWSGWFNPHCDQVADPGGFIADYVAHIILNRVT